MEEEECPEVKYIDREDFENLTQCQQLSELQFRWIDAFKLEEEKWHRYLSKTIATLSGRNGLCFRIVERYARALRSQGAELVNSEGKGRYPIRSIAPKSDGVAGNLPIVLKNVSSATKCVNQAKYVGKVINHYGIGEGKMFTRIVAQERINLLHLFHEGYLTGMEHYLSNIRLLRNYRRFSRSKRNPKALNPVLVSSGVDYFSLVPQASLMALQTVLDDWNVDKMLKNEKIIQTAHTNTLQMRALHVRGDAIFVLNESLICMMALGSSSSYQEEMAEFDAILTPRAVNSTAKLRFTAWKLMSKAYRTKGNAQGLVNVAQRLEQESEGKEVGDQCSVIIETACAIRTECGAMEEKIVETISSTISRHASLGPRMLEVAEKCKIGYERDNLLGQICDSQELHPSEPLWLEFVEKQSKLIGKVRSIKEGLQKCLTALFEYLDFDTNRCDEKAWFLMKKVLEMSDPTFVVPEWRKRKSWWPKYHRNRRKHRVTMGSQALKVREEVLEALELLNCE